MKYRNLLIFPVLLLLFSAAGCSKKTGEGPTPTPAADSGESAFDLPAVVLDEGWPEASVPAELPEYTEGTVVNSGEDGDTLYIKIRDTDEDELGDYLDRLKEAGWIVTGDSEEAEAVKDLYTADFIWQDGGAMLQMTLYTGEAGDWPSDKIPPDVLQPQTGSLVEKIEVLESMENAWYFNYTYDGIDETGAQECGIL